MICSICVICNKSGVVKRQILHQLINIFWTVLAFAPIIAFWLAAGLNIVFYLLLTLSLCVLFLPDRIYRQIQMSDHIRDYEKLWLKTFRKFTQEGDYVQQLIARGQGTLRMSRTKRNFINYGKTIAIYERYHLLCMVFFLVSAIYAIVLTNLAIALLITIANIIYNVMPLLLQQHNRLRIAKMLERLS